MDKVLGFADRKYLLELLGSEKQLQININTNDKPNWRDYNWQDLVKDYVVNAKKNRRVNEFYRIKPESKIVPFDYTDDLIGLKLIDNVFGHRVQVVEQSEIGVFTGRDGAYTYLELLHNFKIYQGDILSPCGKEEK